ncbi:MAG: glycosyltransferase family 2 protein [Treponema sp.]|nr:glycosyltransferase family 2 protein [Treponema sp.]
MAVIHSRNKKRTTMMTAFVILHYLAYDMTYECVSTLLNNFGESEIHIVVVDNASPNGSGQQLADTFATQEKVHVILNKANLGFAKGNNIGYEYAKTLFSPDFIIVMNNDVLIDDAAFLEDIQRIYDEQNFAVLGPDIYNPKTKRHQNPLYLNGNSKENVTKMRSRLQRELPHFAFHYYKNRLLAPVKKIIKTLFFPKKIKQVNLDRTKVYENPVLQGACYIFSKDFIQARDYAFYPETFLYFEEDILHLQCQQQNLKMLYVPNIQIKHLEDVSTNMILKTNLSKEKMKSENLIHSMTAFINLTTSLVCPNEQENKKQR